MVPPQHYQVQRGQTFHLYAQRSISRQHTPSLAAPGVSGNTQQPANQQIHLGFNVTGADNAIIASVPKHPVELKCVRLAGFRVGDR